MKKIIITIVTLLILILIILGVVLITDKNKETKNNNTNNTNDTTINTDTFVDTILKDNYLRANDPVLTTSSNNTSDVSGLYESNDTNSGNSTYYFRGNVENNYVSFAGFTWRIIRINEDNTIRLILDNEINDNETYQFSTDYDSIENMYYSNSNVKTILENWYDTNLSNYSSYIASGNYFCEEARTKASIDYTSGSATMTEYTNYTSSFKCSTDGNGYGLVNSSIGLITYDEALFAGGYAFSENTLYYLYSDTSYWTMSPIGYDGENASVWQISNNGEISRSGRVYGSKNSLKPVININSNTKVTGTGIESDPYVIG